MAYPVPAAKTALKALLDARPAWNAVDIRDEMPTEKEDVTRDAFWFTQTDIPQDGWASLGAQRRRVTFLIGFNLLVIREGDDPRATEDVMWLLVEDLLATIKANPTLSGSVQQVDDVTGQQVNEPAPNQWWAVFKGQIHCLSKAY